MATFSASRVEEARKLVAIVDDDASVRRSMDRLIRSFGYRTQVSASADEFLASTAPDRAACLLLDVRMPGTDGLAVQRRLIEGGTPIATVCENPLVIAREDPGEFIAQFDAMFAGTSRLEAMSRSALRTAREYTWQRVLERHLLPCIGAFDGLARDALRVA